MRFANLSDFERALGFSFALGEGGCLGAGIAVCLGTETDRKRIDRVITEMLWGAAPSNSSPNGGSGPTCLCLSFDLVVGPCVSTGCLDELGGETQELTGVS